MSVDLVVFGGLSDMGKSGLSLFHFRLAKYFAYKNLLHHVYALHLTRSSDYLSNVSVYCLHEKIFFKILIKVIRKLRRVFPQLPVRLMEEMLFDKVVSRKIRSSQADILILTKPVTPGLMRQARKAGKRIIVIATVSHPAYIKSQIRRMEIEYHVKDRSSYSNLKRMSRLIEVYNSADLIVPRIPSEFVRMTYLSNGISDDRFFKLNKSVRFILDDALFNTSNKTGKTHTGIKFVTAGFMNLKKGLPLLIEAWSQLHNEGKLAQCELFVYGSLDKTMQVVLGSKPMPDNVHFPGFAKNIYDQFKHNDVFLAASVCDLGPRTIQEAMACGMPVIASSHCGMAEYIEEGVNGLIYDPFDIDALKNSILFFSQNPDKIQAMGDEAARVVRQTDSSLFFEELHRACRQLI